MNRSKPLTSKTPLSRGTSQLARGGKVRSVSKRRQKARQSAEGQAGLAYMRAVRELPCVICDAFGEPQLSPTAAHHPIHGRYSARKAPDLTCIPLCEGHHQGLLDTSKLALHQRPSEWRRTYGPDADYIAVTQDRLAHLLEANA